VSELDVTLKNNCWCVLPPVANLHFKHCKGQFDLLLMHKQGCQVQMHQTCQISWQNMPNIFKKHH